MQILLTAFEPYDHWTENSSWLAMIEMLRDQPSEVQLTTRRYPVNLQLLQERLTEDLKRPFDAVLHLGQCPGASSIKLESFALNVAGRVEEKGEELPALVSDGPLAFRSAMPLGFWASALRNAQIPACVSYHAGTFLCNAAMYLTHHLCQQQRLDVPIGFIHLPLATEQVAKLRPSMPSLPQAVLGDAVHLVLNKLYEWYPSQSRDAVSTT